LRPYQPSSHFSFHHIGLYYFCTVIIHGYYFIAHDSAVGIVATWCGAAVL